MITITGSKLWLINFYREQLDKFTKVGLGKKTENNVLITKELIKNTKKRLNEITVVYDRDMTPQAIKLRKLKRIRLKRKGQLDDKYNNNGAAPTSSSKDICTNGHEGSKT